MIRVMMFRYAHAATATAAAARRRRPPSPPAAAHHHSRHRRRRLDQPTPACEFTYTYRIYLPSLFLSCVTSFPLLLYLFFLTCKDILSYTFFYLMI